MADVDQRGYYHTLGLDSDASASAIRGAYVTLAMDGVLGVSQALGIIWTISRIVRKLKWHPDKCCREDQVDAKVKFQHVQEAYEVLSDPRKKVLYDFGLYDPTDDEDEIEGMSSIIDEMSRIIEKMPASEFHKRATFEELQQMFTEIFGSE